MYKKIKSYENYLISNNGVVKSIDRKIVCKNGIVKNIKGKTIKPVLFNTGYYRVNLCNKGNQKLFYIHRLVAETFIPNPENKAQVNHKNCDRKNNNINNLEWVTCSEQAKHSWIKHPNRKMNKTKITKETRRKAFELFDIGISKNKIEKILKIPHSTCTKLLKGVG